jgi:hypothetical protein
MHESFEPASNVSVERLGHSAKHFSQSLSTEHGMQIDESDKHLKNAWFSMHETFEPDSNVTLDIITQLAKQNGPNVLMFFGMATSLRFPTSLLIVIDPKSRMKCPFTLKWGFPSPSLEAAAEGKLMRLFRNCDLWAFSVGFVSESG